MLHIVILPLALLAAYWFAIGYCKLIGYLSGN